MRSTSLVDEIVDSDKKLEDVVKLKDENKQKGLKKIFNSIVYRDIRDLFYIWEWQINIKKVQHVAIRHICLKQQRRHARFSFSKYRKGILEDKQEEFNLKRIDEVKVRLVAR